MGRKGKYPVAQISINKVKIKIPPKGTLFLVTFILLIELLPMSAYIMMCKFFFLHLLLPLLHFKMNAQLAVVIAFEKYKKFCSFIDQKYLLFSYKADLLFRA
jgi:hypothetical protein